MTRTVRFALIIFLAVVRPLRSDRLASAESVPAVRRLQERAAAGGRGTGCRNWHGFSLFHPPQALDCRLR